MKKISKVKKFTKKPGKSSKKVAAKVKKTAVKKAAKKVKPAAKAASGRPKKVGTLSQKIFNQAIKQASEVITKTLFIKAFEVNLTRKDTGKIISDFTRALKESLSSLPDLSAKTKIVKEKAVKPVKAVVSQKPFNLTAPPAKKRGRPSKATTLEATGSKNIKAKVKPGRNGLANATPRKGGNGLDTATPHKSSLSSDNIVSAPSKISEAI